MIPVTQLLYKIDFKLNKIATTEGQYIPEENKLLALNEAQIKLIKTKVGTVGQGGIGFDSYRKRYEDLQNLVVPHTGISVTKGSTVLPTYLASLPADYFLPIDLYVTAKKNKCKDRPVYVEVIAKHSDVSTLLANTHYKPSFEWQSTFATISRNKVDVYVEDFEVQKLYLSYLRYPKEIDKAGYTKLDGTASINQDCELPLHLEDELVDLTVQQLAMYTENLNAAASAQNRINNNE